MRELSFREVQLTELEILLFFDKLCKQHNLKYYLTGGTLLGAIRHKGFIPWDDDIDLIMPREDYEELLSIWDRVAPKGYILQNTRNAPDFTQNFTKIRKDHTVFLQSEEERGKNYHKGIFVDILPGDRVAPTKAGRKIQYFAFAVNLLYSRGYTSGSAGIIGLAERILLKLPKDRQIAYRQSAERWICRWKGFHTEKFVFSSTIKSCRKYYPANLFDKPTTIEFCGKQYQCVSDPDEVLRLGYGDYMQLPPEEERVWTHHPVLIDFEHNYEELGKQ